MNSEEITRLFVSRQEQAIEECYRAYGKLCRGVAFSVLRSEQDAEEVVWETMMKAWNSIPPAVPLNISAYLIKVARNTALDRLRNRCAEKRRDGEYYTAIDEITWCLPDSFTEAERDSSEIGGLISRWLKLQPKEKRLAFCARYFLLMSEKETAAKLGMSTGKLKSMLRRMRENLRKMLEEEGYHV